MSETPRRVFVRRRIGVFALVAIVLTLAFYLPLTLLAPLPAVASVNPHYSLASYRAPVIALPNYGASAISAVGYPRVLAQGGSTAPLPIASITKIITTLVVLEKKPLAVGHAGPSITFTAADDAIRKAYQARGGDVYPIQVGGSMSQRDVMTVTLVASANNYARSLVDWAYGSEASFLPVAKSWLAAHGMNSTVLTDATGLNAANRSTPADLLVLGKLALANPLIAQLVKIPSITLPVVGAISNTNKLLGHDGVDGIKTGTLNGAGASLLFSSTYVISGQTIQLIGVILDGPDHPTIDSQIQSIIATVRSGFHTLTLAKTGQSFGSYETKWGATASVVATLDRSIVVWAGTGGTVRVVTSRLTVGRKGLIVGSAIFVIGGQTLTVPLSLSRTVADPGGWWRLTNPTELV